MLLLIYKTVQFYTILRGWEILPKYKNEKIRKRGKGDKNIINQTSTSKIEINKIRWVGVLKVKIDANGELLSDSNRGVENYCNSFFVILLVCFDWIILNNNSCLRRLSKMDNLRKWVKWLWPKPCELEAEVYLWYA